MSDIEPDRRADTEADSDADMRERLVADECPNRPGRGHEWYRRTSDRVSFCRDCGYGWPDS